MKRPAAGLLLVLFALAIAPPVLAARWDPRLRWHTIVTKHFAISYHQGLEVQALELAHVTEEVHAILSPHLQWVPLERTQVVLVDATDSPNGYASALPGNRIVLYTTAPDAGSALGNHQDWLWAIFVHEYTHTLQIDMVDGLPLVARFILGRTITPNSVMPRWLTEGYAVYLETLYTAGGRARSTTTDMLIRAAALDGTWPRIDTAEGFGSRWPGGQLRYLFGGRFHLWVAGEVDARGGDGRAAWVDFHRRHSRFVVPFLLPSREAFGATFVPMWQRWRRAEQERAHALADRLAREGLTPLERIPTPQGQALAPRRAADGRLAWLHTSPSGPAAVRLQDQRGETRRVGDGLGGLRWAPDGQHLYGTAMGYTSRYASWSDLFRLDVDTGQRLRLTRGARLRDPAPHPDGGWLIAVQNHGGRSQLVRVDLPDTLHARDQQDAAARETWAATARELREATTDTERLRLRRRLRELKRQRRPLRRQRRAADRRAGAHERRWDRTRGGDPTQPRSEPPNPMRARVTPWTAAGDFSQYSDPEWSPDGRLLAVSVWKPGGFRDIHIFDTEGRHLRALSWDRADDAEPTWTPDGRYLLWASDRDGIWNLYAERQADGAVFRVTRVTGGLRAPDVADGWITAQSYGGAGWSLVRLPLAPDTWEPSPLPARALPSPDQGPSAQALAPRSDSEGLPGNDVPVGHGPDDAVARDRARPDFRTLAGAPQPDELDVAAEAEAQGWRHRRYNPLATLFPPRYVSPFGYLTSTGALGGLAIGGADPLDQHRWTAQINYRTDSRYIGWGVGYLLNAFHPRLSASFDTSTLDYGSLWLRAPGPQRPGGARLGGTFRGSDRYFERRDRFTLALGLPLGERHTLSASYRLDFRRPLRPVSPDADPRFLPMRGSFSGLSLGWTYGRFERYSTSVSPERSELVTVSLDLQSSYLGAWQDLPDGSRAPIHRGILTAEARRYLALPWAANHVLALRAVGGFTLGTQIPQHTFRIGGAYGDSPYLSLPDRYYALRGYPTSSLRGDHLWLATAEYRMPLLLIERGPWTAPAQVRGLSLAVFAEAGQTFSDEDVTASLDGLLAWLQATRPALGVELVADAWLGWGGLFQARLGYGLGFGAGAQPGGQFYVQLGSSF